MRWILSIFGLNLIYRKRQTSRFARKVSNRLLSYYISYFRKRLLSRISDVATPPEIIWTDREAELFEQQFFYKDESWPEIQNLEKICWDAHWGVAPQTAIPFRCENTRLTFTESGFSVDSSEDTERRWVFLHRLDPLGPIYAMEFDVEIRSEFTELQFAFNFHHIMKRLRFMIVDNEELVFDVVDCGFFFHKLRSVPCRLDIGKSYNIRIEVMGNTYAWYLDGNCLLTLSLDGWRGDKDTTSALIFFERSAARSILANVSNLQWFIGSKRVEA